ncbi:SDR family NAD(P)-dependent oxidoreductase [Arenibaculum sp.]|uniref:SDR family NAD(P)-dependent oxidoreductase n=1 Tax=Arenibaculum sp. TaxID=2865862 RepID=UPI002E166890|nr:SDR family oxidoreductase [Arenibaculum sp.]
MENGGTQTGGNAPLAGRHALVTGAARGIGAAIARRLATDGARLTLLGRDAGALSDLAGETGAAIVTADVTDDEAVAAAFAAAGPVDILVNNAGMARTAPFRRLDREHWDAMLAVNLTGVYTCIRAALPAMTERGWGRVVNVASTAGLKGYPYVAAYVAAKHGVVGLTRALALETARAGITVNAVCPGYTDTELVHKALETIQARTGRSRDDALQELTRANPQGRLVRPEEVADAVAWLCGPAAASVTGQAVAIDGGELA